MAALIHVHQWLRLSVGDLQDRLCAQHRDEVAGRGRHQLPRRAPDHRPAQNQGRLPLCRIDRSGRCRPGGVGQAVVVILNDVDTFNGPSIETLAHLAKLRKPDESSWNSNSIRALITGF